MKSVSRHWLGWLSGLALMGPVAAQEAWPTRALKLIVPFQAGSATDAAARVVATKLAVHLQQPVVIENRIGASGFIGAEFVARAPADGYTLLWGTTSTQAVGPSLKPTISYDPLKDFAPVGLVAFSPYLLVSSSRLGYKNLGDFIAEAKANPGKLTYASAGASSMGNLSAQLFGMNAKVQLVHIPYKSSAQSVSDTMTGTVTVQFSTFSPVLAHVKTGSLKPLAVTSKTRSPLFPDVPTVSEAGVPGYEAVLWMGIFTHQAVGSPVLEKLSAALKATLNDPEVQKYLQGQGLQVSNMGREELDKFVRSEISKWSQVIKAAGIVAE